MPAILPSRRLEQLYTEFDRIHKNIVKKTFVSNSSFYAPTYSALRILSAQTDEKRGWSFLKKSRASLDKGKTSMTNGVLNELSKEAVDAMKKAGSCSLLLVRVQYRYSYLISSILFRNRREASRIGRDGTSIGRRSFRSWITSRMVSFFALF